MRAAADLPPPPRTLPVSLQILILLSGIATVVGWVVLGVGLVFATLFTRHAEPLFGDPFDGPSTSMRGTVVDVRDTAIKIDKSRVLAVHFELPRTEPAARGISYTTLPSPAIGSEVEIEISRTEPTATRIRGMRTHPMPALMQLLMLLPIAGAVVVLLAMRTNLARMRLLQRGEVATGTLVDQQATNTKVNNQRVYRLTFRFVDRNQRERLAVARTHRIARLTDEPGETVLHDPDGDAALLLDSLPVPVEVDGQGQLQAPPFGSLAVVLIAPSVVAVLASLANWLADQVG
jgi:hypothetical protein